MASSVAAMALQTLADRMLWARKRAKLSQKAAADAVGISQTLISQLESGARQSTTTIASLANAYAVSALWLERGTGTPEPGSVRETAATYRADVNESDLTVVIDAVETWLSESRRELPPTEKAQLIVSLYKMLPDALAEADRLATKPKVVSLLETFERLHGSATGTQGTAAAGAAESQPAKRAKRRHAGH